MDMQTIYHQIRLATNITVRRMLNKPKLLTAQVLFNNNCNQRCAYCSLPKEHEIEIIRYDKALRILECLKREGTLQLSIAGGEPTIHPDYHRIIRKCRELGFYTTVSSNGFLHDALLKVHKNERPHLVSISLDGPQEVHETYRNKGSWIKAVEALHGLKEIGVPRAINCVIGSHNCDVSNIKWLLEKADEVGANFSFQFMIPTLGNFDDGSNKFSADVAGLKRLVKDVIAIPQRDRKRFIFDDELLKEFLTWDSLVPCYRNTPGKQCFAGKYFGYIDSDCSLYPCGLLFGHSRYKGNKIFDVGWNEAIRCIEKIPCNDCYLGCNVLRNRIFNFNLHTLKNITKILGDR